MSQAVGEGARTAELEAWVRFLRAHAAVTRELSAELVREHGLTINDYEVLLHLSRAPERMLRRVDLAERVLLTASGITRLLDGLERAGHVEKRACAEDGRVSYARLTDAGLEKLRAAGVTHLDGVSRLYLGRFDADERETLAALLDRLPGNAGQAAEPCSAE
jgi:DNA-binding MarR family transcriptional regulator